MAVQRFSYSGGTLLQIVPYLLPFLILPEMIALDFLLPSLRLRILSDVFHLGVLIGSFWIWLGARQRPHTIDGEVVTLCRGPFPSLVFARNLVQCAQEVTSRSSKPAFGRSKENSFVWLTLPGTPMVEICFRRPVNVTLPLRRGSPVRGILVAVDDPRAFCRALR